MKRLIIITSAVFLSFNSFSQDSQTIHPSNTKFQKIAYFDLLYGGPVMQPRYINETFDKVNAYSPGQFGIRFDILLHRRHSIGLETNYMPLTLKSEPDLTYYYDGSTTPSHSGQINLSRTRSYVRYCFHFIQKERFDFFLHAGVGISSLNISKNIELYEDKDYGNGVKGRQTSKFNNDVELAVRTGIGIRYLISNRFGFNADLAVGGVLATAGLTFKISKNSAK